MQNTSQAVLALYQPFFLRGKSALKGIWDVWGIRVVIGMDWYVSNITSEIYVYIYIYIYIYIPYDLGHVDACRQSIITHWYQSSLRRREVGRPHINTTFQSSPISI